MEAFPEGVLFKCTEVKNSRLWRREKSERRRVRRIGRIMRGE